MADFDEELANIALADPSLEQVRDMAGRARELSAKVLSAGSIASYTGGLCRVFRFFAEHGPSRFSKSFLKQAINAIEPGDSVAQNAKRLEMLQVMAASGDGMKLQRFRYFASAAFMGYVKKLVIARARMSNFGLTTFLAQLGQEDEEFVQTLNALSPQELDEMFPWPFVEAFATDDLMVHFVKGTGFMGTRMMPVSY